MSKIAILTDSNSGISMKKAKAYGVNVIPMPFNINGVEYLEGVDLSHNEFFRLQQDGAKIFTSQPSPASVMEMWDKLLEENDYVIHIPMAGNLSSSMATAVAMSADYDGRVIVVDNQRVSMSQKQAVLEAKMLADEGKSATEISQILTYHKDDASIYITVDDLKYLKAGGRINAATAAVGSVLNIKPILSVKDGRIEAVGKARGIKAAQKQILQNLDKDMEEKFHSDNIDDYVIYTAAALPREEAIAWNDKVKEHFGAFSQIEAVPLSIATHVGIGAFGACLCKRIFK